MTAVLGISAFYHDSAAAIVVDGEIIAAAQEERFSRKKHDERFPIEAARYCLNAAGRTIEEIDYIAFYDKPFRKFERLLETYLSFAPFGYSSFRRAMPQWLQKKLHLPREIRNAFEGRFRGRLIFTEHHESHAASAFYPSPFDEAAILTMDGVGEWATTTTGIGRGHQIELTHEIRFPHSLGLLYSAFTYYAGFRVNSGEYKLMGLAPYGQPLYRERILEHLLHLHDDGSFRMEMSYFNYCQGLTMTSEKFHRLFDGPPRQPESQLTQREMDLAASIQSVTEEVMLRIARHVRKETNQKNLVLAGGVALNCVGNGKIFKEDIFDQIFIQPASGDAGGALGAALFVWHQLLEKPRAVQKPDAQKGSFLGPEWSTTEMTSFLRAQGAVFDCMDSEDSLCDRVAELLAAENVVGWFQGRMEFGPRALGARSILGDARSPRMQSQMNLKIKFRESFRPFAPVVLKDHVHEYFEMAPGTDSPYMLLVADVRESRRTPKQSDVHDASGIELLNQVRSSIPAVTHVDYSARVQTADEVRHPLTCQLLRKFRDLTGCPLLINTSFNVRSEPIVCTPEDAWRCFMSTEMDVLVLGTCIILKSDQPNSANPADRIRHLQQFELD